MKFATLMIFVFFCGSISIADAQEISIIETGEFHGDEVSAHDGEEWLGLFNSDGKYMLMPSVVSVEKAFDPIVDSKGQATGAKITVRGMSDPLFLVKGSGFDVARPAITVERSVGSLNSAEGISFVLAGSLYRLFIESKNAGPSGFVTGNSKLYFSVGGVRQVLYEVDECDSCQWRLNWAGDLDSDGKPDLYLLVTPHYNVAIQKLFLSSRAENGKLVKEVAEFTTTGC